MAPSILGKRTRSSWILEETAPTYASPTKRRRGQPTHIHVDNEDAPATAVSHDADQPLFSNGPQDDKEQPSHGRNVSTKRTVRNNRIALSPAKGNARSKVPAASTSEEEQIIFKTPTTQRFKDAFDTENPQTPKRFVKLPGRPLTPRLIRTPSTPSRCHTIYSAARQLFAQSGNPGQLIGRDAERQELTTFLSSRIDSKTGGCLYISGPPGTGKSALLEEVYRSIDQFSAVKAAYVNCVSVKTSKDIYVKVSRDLNIPSASAAKFPETVLSNLFVPRLETAGDVYVVMLDEIDHLTSDFNVLGKLFEWALGINSRLVLVGIANALDLTDRFLPHLKNRNLKPQLLPFQPYSATQISSIITKRLQSLLPEGSLSPSFVPFMHPAAIQLVSKKVATQTGDLRKAFSIIRRAIDLVENETLEKQQKVATAQSSPSKSPLVNNANLSSPVQGILTPPASSPLDPVTPVSSARTVLTVETAPRVSIPHVARIASAIFNNGTVQRLAGLNLQQKAVLCGLVAMEKRKLERARNRDPFSTPSKHANPALPTVREMFDVYCGLCKRDNVLHPLTVTEFRDVVAGLETLGLVFESKGRMGSFKSAAMTPARTPSKLGRGGAEEKQMCTGVTEKEVEESIQGPGMEILRTLLAGAGL